MFISPPEIAQVIAPYTATGAEQLTLAPGQLILIRKKNPGGWWEGELQVCKFPDIAERYYRLFIKRSSISSLPTVRGDALSTGYLPSCIRSSSMFKVEFGWLRGHSVAEHSCTL